MNICTIYVSLRADAVIYIRNSLTCKRTLKVSNRNSGSPHALHTARQNNAHIDGTELDQCPRGDECVVDLWNNRLNGNVGRYHATMSWDFKIQPSWRLGLPRGNDWVNKPSDPCEPTTHAQDLTAEQLVLVRVLCLRAIYSWTYQRYCYLYLKYCVGSVEFLTCYYRVKSTNKIGLVPLPTQSHDRTFGPSKLGCVIAQTCARQIGGSTEIPNHFNSHNHARWVPGLIDQRGQRFERTKTTWVTALQIAYSA